MKKRWFGRSTSSGVHDRPAEDPAWVGRAYGPRAAQLVNDLAHMMQAAEVESKVPRTQDPTPLHDGTERQSLTEHLVALRDVMVAVDVSADDHDRDLHLRAALSSAIGAASTLASASHSQPTSGYLSIAKPAIDEVLVAAGRPMVR
ncbi:MAG: hypothetical protein ACYDAC_00435 [Candidatus Dormibacteria bacterium]